MSEEETEFRPETTESEVDDNEELRLTRKATMTRFIKSFSKNENTRITSEAKEVLMGQLEQLTIILFRRAEELSREAQRLTIYPDDLEKAYEELMKPHVFIEEMVDKLDAQKLELREIARKSVLRHMED
ncbi:histone-like protein [Peribacillus frigoritolerans]|uniref:histone-like protein n=1 Tax=Peribacillus frigoritolerans TaxID=450367 RepID=UPI0039A31463